MIKRQCIEKLPKMYATDVKFVVKNKQAYLKKKIQKYLMSGRQARKSLTIKKVKVKIILTILPSFIRNLNWSVWQRSLWLYFVYSSLLTNK